MKKIELNIGDEIQGKFELKKLNLLLVFQVNCPGCFSYALPFFNKLYDAYDTQGVSFVAMSTAFEDFDKNTLKHTQDLVQHGILVGETKKMMSQYGYETLPYALKFPLVMDSFDTTEVNSDTIIESFCNTNSQYYDWSEKEKGIFQKRIAHYVASLDKIALTFTLNQLKGTPSFILFNENYEIIADWFGHVPYETISGEIDQQLAIITS